jgi:hypothetical protein
MLLQGRTGLWRGNRAQQLDSSQTHLFMGQRHFLQKLALFTRQFGRNLADERLIRTEALTDRRYRGCIEPA